MQVNASVVFAWRALAQSEAPSRRRPAANAKPTSHARDVKGQPLHVTSKSSRPYIVILTPPLLCLTTYTTYSAQISPRTRNHEARQVGFSSQQSARASHMLKDCSQGRLDKSMTDSHERRFLMKCTNETVTVELKTGKCTTQHIHESQDTAEPNH